VMASRECGRARIEVGDRWTAGGEIGSRIGLGGPGGHGRDCAGAVGVKAKIEVGCRSDTAGRGPGRRCRDRGGLEHLGWVCP